MWVQKYLPDRQYGFVADEQGRQAYFHLGSFDPGPEGPSRSCPQSLCPAQGRCPLTVPFLPPVLGELVEATLPPGAELGGEKAPRATRVLRIEAQRALKGRVDTFDASRGYGFAIGEDGASYHLHRSEIPEGTLPVVGNALAFVAGTRQGRPRACHARICSWTR